MCGAGVARVSAKSGLPELIPPIPRPAAPQVNRPDVLELEPAVAQAELILAVRLVEVTETKIVQADATFRSPSNTGSSQSAF